MAIALLNGSSSQCMLEVIHEDDFRSDVSAAALGIFPMNAKPFNPPVLMQQQPEPERKTFTGTVIKNADKFMLSDSAGKLSYGLDDQGKAGPYEGKKVQVIGTLDLATNTIHVESIQEIA
jgi:Protein of unknown function (DUF5818)